MKIVAIVFICIWVWIIREVINAPFMDDCGNIISEKEAYEILKSKKK